MFEQLKDDPEQKKDDRAAQDDAANDAVQRNQGQTGAAHGAATRAAPLMSQWAEGAGPAKAGDQAQAGEQAKAPKPHRVHDERFSEDDDVVQDGEGRILSVQIEGGRTRITIGLGRKQGVHAGMEGYIKQGSGVLANFQVEDAGDRVCHATVDVTPDEIYRNPYVVVNPSQKPRSSEAQADMKARLLNFSIVDGRTQITIGRGEGHGARAGMVGYLLGSGGKRVARFQIDETRSTYSLAFVDRTIDEIKDLSDIILNPAGG